MNVSDALGAWSKKDIVQADIFDSEIESACFLLLKQAFKSTVLSVAIETFWGPFVTGTSKTAKKDPSINDTEGLKMVVIV